jgi:very-short-patch-repair endonuclease
MKMFIFDCRAVLINIEYMRSRVIERNMFYGASPNIFEKASALRKNMTPAEKILWNELRNRKIFKVKFRRQHPIDIFIVDFYCHEYKLAIELDGEIHLQKKVMEHDDGRSHDLEKLGIIILRFTNNQIYNNISNVKNDILKAISLSGQTPLQEGRGVIY